MNYKMCQRTLSSTTVATLLTFRTRRPLVAQPGVKGGRGGGGEGGEEGEGEERGTTRLKGVVKHAQRKDFYSLCQVLYMYMYMYRSMHIPGNVYYMYFLESDSQFSIHEATLWHSQKEQSRE